MYLEVAADLDTTTDTGYYSTTPELTTNLPDNAYPYGVLEVFGGANLIVQRYTPHSKYSGKYGEYNRVRYAGTWVDWRFIPYQ